MQSLPSLGRLWLSRIPKPLKNVHIVPICSSRIFYPPSISAVRQLHSDKDDKILNDTSAIVQEGLHIDELPCIVRIVHGDFVIHGSGRTLKGIKFHGIRLQTIPNPTVEKRKEESSFEESEMIAGFNRCTSLSDLYFLLSYCPEDEVTAPVALAIIKNLIQLENNKKFRNPNLDPPDTVESEQPHHVVGNNVITFTRAAVMERLVDTICKSGNPELVMDTVKALRKDTNKEEKAVYLKQLCNECLVLVSDGKLSVIQIASLAQDLHLLKEDFTKHFADKLWPGLDSGIDDLDADGLCQLFAMLPYIKLSRNYVFHLAEKRALKIWYQFRADNIIQIISILVACNCHSHKLVTAISRWTNVNIHVLSEENLRWILIAFTKLFFIDDNIKKAIKRYTKAKKTNISDPALVMTILDYCSTSRFRSPEILEICSDYFIKYHADISAPEIFVFCNTFGQLNYLPKNSTEYFKILETLLERHFVSFPPDLFMDMMLSCVYLQRYPLNFVKKIYHPFFFRRIVSLNHADARKTQTKLRVLDKAMSLEASCYEGPMIHRSSHQSTWPYRDFRITKSIVHLRRVLLNIAGDPNRLFLTSQLPGFPVCDLYKVDCIIDTTIKPGIECDLPADLNKRLALLIHVPEHYDIDKKELLGLQAMRARQLGLVGLLVVNLEYEILNSYYKNPKRAKHYIVERIMEELCKLEQKEK